MYLAESCKKMSSFFAYCFVLLLSVNFLQCHELRFLGEKSIDDVSFTVLYEHPEPDDPTERYSLTVTTMSTEQEVNDTLLYLEYPGKHLDDIKGMDSRVLADGMRTPRQTGQIPYEVFNQEALSQPSGFLLPGKRVGEVALISLEDWSSPTYTDITTGAGGDTDSWFYHRVLWRDADLDGDLDAFMCRARVEDGKTDSQFVWLANPGGEDAVNTGPWDDVHVISEDVCDAFSKQVTLQADGQEFDVTFTFGFFTDLLSVYWSTDEDNRWDDNSFIEKRIIENASPDHFFDGEIIDMNGDGKLDILATINSETNGSLIVYEIPDDFRTGEYVKHVIASGFSSSNPIQRGGAPGMPSAFYPETNMGGKPWILMNGNSDGKAYYFSPVSSDPDNWEYEEVEFMNEGMLNMVGNTAAADVDGDEFVEVFVPAWTKGLLKVFTFAPEL